MQGEAGAKACELLTVFKGMKTKRERPFPTFWDRRTLNNSKKKMMEKRWTPEYMMPMQAALCKRGAQKPTPTLQSY